MVRRNGKQEENFFKNRGCFTGLVWEMENLIILLTDFHEPISITNSIHI